MGGEENLPQFSKKKMPLVEKVLTFLLCQGLSKIVLPKCHTNTDSTLRATKP